MFYRFASLNLTDLLNNLEGDIKLARTVAASFVDQFLMSLPQAKRTSTAPHTIPDLAYLAVREHRPLSLAAAFETPVAADYQRGGFSLPSRAALSAYAVEMNRLTADRGRIFHGHASVDSEPWAGLGEHHTSFHALNDTAVTAAFSVLGGDGGEA